MENEANPIFPIAPPPETKPIPTQEEIKLADDRNSADEKPKVDHFAEIAELVSGLENTTPSGANLIGSKIMFHVGALADPKAFEKSEAEKRKAEDKANEEQLKRTKDAKAGVKAA